MPHSAMVAMFGAAALYAISPSSLSLRAFWRDIKGDDPARRRLALAGDARHRVLRYLGGGGGGCTSEDEQPSAQRRLYHHFTFYGFLLCFAATCVATLYHYAFGWHAPYAPWSLPVALGIIGGLGLLVGPVGLFVLAAPPRHRPARSAASRHGHGVDRMLLLTSVTGFALLVFRDHGAMGLLLAVHLGVVLGLFLSLPYGKFVHGLYRFAALMKYAGERRCGAFVEQGV